MFSNWLNSRAVTQFNQLQERQARLMLQRLIKVLGDPHPFDKVKRALFRNAASSTLELAYGYSLQGEDDPIFHNLDQLAHIGAFAAMFTNFFVNIFPSLIYVPDWFPGTGWKRTAREWGALKDRAQTAPYEWTKAQLTATTLISFVAAMVLNPHVQAKAQEEIDNVLGPMSLPTLADRERLPYVWNLVQEVLRWQPAAPTGT
ncbi:unnamed protein product [Rhizoctonia solani]|uniref:O-methylsterigmatocystin oxidoreductase n=1 Tax=Rhizoctonia solani TaxID=456999 RepID=A0A8H3CHT9_9AGAM|nr:unnamed protein product [Rhizoctonia solani]